MILAVVWHHIFPTPEAPLVQVNFHNSADGANCSSLHNARGKRFVCLRRFKHIWRRTMHVDLAESSSTWQERFKSWLFSLAFPQWYRVNKRCSLGNEGKGKDMVKKYMGKSEGWGSNNSDQWVVTEGTALVFSITSPTHHHLLLGDASCGRDGRLGRGRVLLSLGIPICLPRDPLLVAFHVVPRHIWHDLKAGAQDEPLEETRETTHKITARAYSASNIICIKAQSSPGLLKQTFGRCTCRPLA